MLENIPCLSFFEVYQKFAVTDSIPMMMSRIHFSFPNIHTISESFNLNLNAKFEHFPSTFIVDEKLFFFSLHIFPLFSWIPEQDAEDE